MFDFNKPIVENKGKRPFVVAHRGISTANIPCNTLAAYQIAIQEQVDVVEIDVDITKDHQFFIFHPGLEHVFLKNGKSVEECTAEEVKFFRYLNQDETVTSYPLPTLQEAFAFLKGKAYIAVDKFWRDIKGITEEIRKAGVEKQVIVKIPNEEKYFEELERYAPDLMAMVVVWYKDTVSEKLLKRNIRLVAIETLFDSDEDEIVSDAYIKTMHEKGILLHANSIIYDEKQVIGSTHTDDRALTTSLEDGWGYYYRKGFDFVQTDWPVQMIRYYDRLTEK